MECLEVEVAAQQATLSLSLPPLPLPQWVPAALVLLLLLLHQALWLRLWRLWWQVQAGLA